MKKGHYRRKMGKYLVLGGALAMGAAFGLDYVQEEVGSSGWFGRFLSGLGVIDDPASDAALYVDRHVDNEYVSPVLKGLGLGSMGLGIESYLSGRRAKKKRRKTRRRKAA